jgi:hypothetical protein
MAGLLSEGIDTLVEVVSCTRNVARLARLVKLSARFGANLRGSGLVNVGLFITGLLEVAAELALIALELTLTLTLTLTLALLPLSVVGGVLHVGLICFCF